MLNARGQENLTSRHPHGVAINQQQAWTSRQLGSKTPGTKFSKTPMRVPLNDENGAHAMTSKAASRIDQSNFATPMTQRARAVLGDKTTNAKAKTIRTVNVKSVVKEIEESQAKLRNTVRAKQREAQAETQKLQVHSEGTDPLGGDRVEYCPPNPKNLPYTSDTLPDGALAFDALRPSHMMNGYYSYYFNPIEESGTSKRERQLQQETKNAIVEGRRKVKDDLENLEWSVKAELESDTKVVKKASTSTKLPAPRKPLSTVRSKNAANVLSMDDTTKSMQRKAAKTSELNKPVAKKSSSFAIPTLRTSRPGSSQLSSIPKKSASELEATSRTTIGYNKGRATASLLTRATTPATLGRKTPTLASVSTHKGGLPRSDTTLSNDSDMTITPARYAHKQASAAADEDHAWRERVPFLSIFNPDNYGDADEGEDEGDPLGVESKALVFPDDEDEEFELKIVD